MIVALLGVLEHLKQNTLHIFTITEEHETGANCIIAIIHRFLSDLVGRKHVPLFLFIQMNDTTRENKIWYVFVYIESLIAWNVFYRAEL